MADQSHANTPSKLPLPSLVGLLIGPGLLAAAWSLLVRESSPFVYSFGVEIIERLVIAARLGAISLAFAMVLLCVKDEFSHDPLLCRARPLFYVILVLGASCMVVPMLPVAAVHVFSAEPTAWSTAYILSFAAGVGVTFLAGLWFDILIRFDADTQLKAIVSNLCILGCCAFAKFGFIDIGGWILYLLCCLGSCACLLLLNNAPIIIASSSTKEVLSVPTSVPQRLISFTKSIWWALAVALITMFLFGFVWNPARVGMPAAPHEVLIVQEALGAFGAAIVIALVSGMHAENLAEKLRQAVLPVAVATFIVTPYFAVDAFGDGYYYFVGCIRECAELIFMATLIFVLTTSIRVADASGFLGTGMCIALAQVVAIAGTACAHTLSGAMAAVPVLLFVLYLVATLIATARHRDMGSKVRAMEEGVFDQYLSSRCSTIASECGLSPREQEILVQLGRGHGYTYIAEASFLSESTVRTHAKSIFRKTNVGSREELLDLIDDRA